MAKRQRPLYHITQIEAAEKILRDGLQGTLKPRNRGETLTAKTIYAITTPVANLVEGVVLQQIRPAADIDEDYVVLRINTKGITGEIKADDVEEETFLHISCS